MPNHLIVISIAFKCFIYLNVFNLNVFNDLNVLYLHVFHFNVYLNVLGILRYYQITFNANISININLNLFF